MDPQQTLQSEPAAARTVHPQTSSDSSPFRFVLFEHSGQRFRLTLKSAVARSSTGITSSTREVALILVKRDLFRI